MCIVVDDSWLIDRLARRYWSDRSKSRHGIDDVHAILWSFLEFAPDEIGWSKISHVKVSD